MKPAFLPLAALSALLAACAGSEPEVAASSDATIAPGSQPPPATKLDQTGRSEAWSAPEPELIEAAAAQGFSDYRTQLDLARAGNEGAMTRIQSYSAFATSDTDTVAASHAVALRELKIIQPDLFDRALEKQQTAAIRNAVILSLDDTNENLR